MPRKVATRCSNSSRLVVILNRWKPPAWTSGQVVNIVPDVFPAEPTSWSQISKVTSSTTFTAPEQGWFKFIGVAKSGDGGGGNTWNSTGTRYYRGGGSGGSGAIVASIFPLEQGETVTITLGSSATIACKGESAYAGAGGNGGSAGTGDVGGRGGSAGTANGGNLINKNGSTGETGGFDTERNTGGSSRTNTYEGFSTTSGAGGYAPGDQSMSADPKSAFAVIFRGNTNLTLAQQNALDITALSLETSRIAQEQTSILLH